MKETNQAGGMVEALMDMALFCDRALRTVEDKNQSSTGEDEDEDKDEDKSSLDTRVSVMMQLKDNVMMHIAVC